MKNPFKRPPDVIIGEPDPYMKRWWIIPKNRFFNIYLHHFLRSDDDRALHDHPWWNVSILLTGGYIEHVPADPADPAGPTRTIRRMAPAIAFRKAEAVHRIELLEDTDDPYYEYRLEQEFKPLEKPVWTIFITGPKIREWGFWCPKGWVHWKRFTKKTGNVSGVGEGCGQ